MKRLLVIAMLAVACDQKDEQSADAAALSAIVPPLPPPSQAPSQTPPPPPSQTPPPPSDAGTACGTKPLPDCPLQAWMKQNMSPAMKSHDWQGMADSLERAATLAPPNYATAGYPNWVSIAKDGANAARAADLEAVKAACRGCHEQYKQKYRAEMRTRPVSP